MLYDTHPARSRLVRRLSGSSRNRKPPARVTQQMARLCLAALRDLQAPPEVRVASVQFLSSRYYYPAVPTLITALKDRDAEVRDAAAQALGSLCDPAALPALRRAARDRTISPNYPAYDTAGFWARSAIETIESALLWLRTTGR